MKVGSGSDVVMACLSPPREDGGNKVFLAHPLKTKLIAESRMKTDKTD